MEIGLRRLINFAAFDAIRTIVASIVHDGFTALSINSDAVLNSRRYG
jgi:hypothetical protein